MAPRVTATCFQEAELAPLRVLVLPHAGGASRALALEWGKSFRAAGLGVELWGVDWSWAADDAALNAARALELVAAVSTQLSSGFFGKPFVLVGHSLGALVALALAHYLERRQFSTPRHVFVSGAAGPGSWTLYDEAELQQDAALLKLLQQWGGTDSELLAIPEQKQKLLTALRADLKLHNALVQWYGQQKEVKIRSDVTVFGGSDDTAAPVDSLPKWKEVCGEGSEFEVRLFPGGHFFLTSAEIQEAFAKAFVAKLEAVSTVVVMESRTLIDGLNSKVGPYPSEKCLHDMFMEAAKRTPDAIAVYYEGKTLTFREVDEQSERLADYLFFAGVRPNCISGIFMEHCIEFVIAYIAALKAGGAYMPLEIVYPPDLLERVMEESKPIIVLTKKKFRNRLPAWQQALELDEGWLESLARQNIPVMPADRTRTHPDDLAYVVMSSGTTGVPKGICCPHRGAVHSYDWRLTHCPYKEDDRVACHVFFVWELLRPMLGNRPLYVIPDDTIFDPVKLVEYLDTHDITRILFTPSLLQLILDTCSREVLVQKLSKLRLVWLCGEVVTLELRDRFVRLFPKCELQNLYSVSECHDVSAVDLAAMSDFDNSLSTKYASCGEVMPNVKAYVLDDDYKPVSVGVPGELYIGGPCLAIGYLNRPEQTAQRFLKHVVPGETVYRTGDRARFLPNGHLELIGRCDFMVKIRGYSVVLGAVESALAQHPLVSNSVVLTEGDEGEDKRLVAYIVPEDWEKVPSASNLREFLKEKLPHYAIPSVFVQLDALPINSASGKLDRKKMPSIEEAKKLRNESIDLSVDPKNLPQTDTEKKLALVWSDLLRLENDSVLHREASFFDVGGHSLLSTRLVSSIRDVFGVQLTLADILSSPELYAIASRIDQSLGGTSEVNATEETTKTEKKVVLPLEAVLDASIYPAATRKAGYSRYRVEMVGLPPRNIFLTGATGFLGVHLVHSLLKYTTSVVFCLVRAADEDAAMDRIRKALDGFALLDEALKFHLEDRVVPVPGNLAQPLLGLDGDIFKMLATEIDAILHNGADVNLVKPYSALKSVNVLGTQEVLRLAVTNGLAKTRVKPVHYISTNGVFPSTLPAPKFLETADLSELSDQLENGYAQSKWVAEQMCHEAAQRGLPVSILRPGNIAPSSLTGQWNTSDFIYLLLKGCAGLGAVPDRSDWYFDMTPVDYAARAIVHFAALRPVEALGQTLHIQNPSPPVKSDAFFPFFTAAMGPSKALAAVEYAEWKRRLQQAAAKSDAPLELQKLAAGLDSFEVYFESSKEFDSALSAELLRAAGIACPTVNQALLATYLDFPKILDVCRRAGVEAVHPGYGFLSENAAFARACREAGVEFIGPPVEAIEAMGSKSASKDIMIRAGVPVTPGYHGEDQSFETLQSEARKIGYPVLIKAVLGGGGKGMRIVDEDKDLREALDACVREGQASFGDGRVLIEKYLRKPRHVELQIFGDKHGNVIHLFERDCSVQRRHQKVLEEAPAVSTGGEFALRKKMGDAAVAAAKAVGYVGAGTVEFLLDEDESFYFMEMNTRLQVEHPVTEMITQQDLVELQLKVAAGQELPIRQEDFKIHGHAVEARIYAENPYNGTLQHLRLPRTSKDVRVDTGIIEGDEVSIFYDPMIAKLIVHGDNRQDALDKMVKALHEYQIVGLPTNIEFVARTADHPAFRKGGVDTSFLNKFGDDVLGSLGAYPSYAKALGAVSLLLLEQIKRRPVGNTSSELHSPWADDSLAHFRSLETLERKLQLSHAHDEASVAVKCLSKDTYEVLLKGESHPAASLSVSGQINDNGDFNFRVDNRSFKGTAVVHHQDLHLFCDDNSQHYEYKFHVPQPSFEPSEGSAGAAAHSKIVAPMPGKVIKVLVKNGDAITADQPLLIMEAMKMEHVIRAPKDGKVQELFCEQDDFVTDGHVLVELD
ncbi:unnamed protein product [Phytophthora lilii]|uniref:Unnamed protein product n=1 Tax=Phytophthora lilii TaxID=2077276 RepID=A0A9W6X5K8_9STRA|nr:unnamed protein product [Phytophthora lilii]